MSQTKISFYTREGRVGSVVVDEDRFISVDPSVKDIVDAFINREKSRLVKDNPLYTVQKVPTTQIRQEINRVKRLRDSVDVSAETFVAAYSKWSNGYIRSAIEPIR